MLPQRGVSKALAHVVFAPLLPLRPVAPPGRPELPRRRLVAAAPGLRRGSAARRHGTRKRLERARKFHRRRRRACRRPARARPASGAVVVLIAETTPC